MNGSQRTQSRQSSPPSTEKPRDKPPPTSTSSTSPASQVSQEPIPSRPSPPESPHKKDPHNGTPRAGAKPSVTTHRDRQQVDSHNGARCKPNNSEPSTYRADAPRSPTSPRYGDRKPVRDPKKELAELRDEVKRLQDKERQRAHELSMEEEQHKETKRLLQSKIAELDGMQAFTKKADQASETDVMDLVKELNAAISQAASYISDPQHLSPVTVKFFEQEFRQATEVVETKLGKEMADTVRTLRDLRRKSRREDPTAVQFALQITMIRLCDKIINAWTPHPDADKWLTGTYEKIRASESQTIAGRWRALTRAQAGGAKDPTAIVNHLVDRLGSVLLAVGSKVPTERFRNSFQKHLASVADVVIRVQTTAGESITSVDVMPYFYPPGTEFTEANMDDMYGSRKTKDSRKGRILGTTELGLWKKEKRTDADGKSEDQKIALLKAKVVFTSSLRE